MNKKQVTITVPSWIAEYWLSESHSELGHWIGVEEHPANNETLRNEAKVFQADWITAQKALSDGLKNKQ